MQFYWTELEARSKEIGGEKGTKKEEEFKLVQMKIGTGAEL